MKELLCLIVLFLGALRGWHNGLVKEVISFVGIFLGFCLAYYAYRQMDVGTLGFLIIWVLVPLLLGTLACLITKLLDGIIIVGTLNKLLGAAAGFLKCAFLLGCIMLAIDYVRDAEAQLERSSLLEILETVPDCLFPYINKE